MKFVHLTFHKCGSQWVRDVLTSNEVRGDSGVPLFVPPYDGLPLFAKWPEQEDNTILGPLYSRSVDEWKLHSSAEHRAVVVLRDPRDMVVSTMHSIALSHATDDNLPVLREPLLSLSPRHRVLVAMICTGIGGALYSWARATSMENALVTTYEMLSKDEIGEFRKIIEFFGWKVSSDALSKAIHRLSFQQRSGRSRGNEEKYSHFRKGLPGDWRDYFDREMGSLFERSYPSLLILLGYEKSHDWFSTLPSTLELPNWDSDQASSESYHSMRAANVRLAEEVRELRRTCGDSDQLITDLSASCDERLKVIGELERVCKERLLLIQKLDRECRERDALIERFDAMCRELKAKGRQG